MSPPFYSTLPLDEVTCPLFLFQVLPISFVIVEVKRLFLPYWDFYTSLKGFKCSSGLFTIFRSGRSHSPDVVHLLQLLFRSGGEVLKKNLL